MKIKVKKLLTLVLCMCAFPYMIFGVAAINSDTDSYGSEVASSSSGWPTASSFSSSRSCDSAVGVSDSLSDFEDEVEKKFTLEEPYREAISVSHELLQPSALAELVNKLRDEQKKANLSHGDVVSCPDGDDGRGVVERRFVYWVNKKLPLCHINLYNKWVGDNLQYANGILLNGVVALFPTSRDLRGSHYTCGQLADIILDESNWIPRKGVQATNTGLCQEPEAEVMSLKDYFAYLRSAGVLCT